ncbi:type 1 glutamine amidotransferase domain-containing protein [Stenotrophomonas sp. SY1]|uniref:type 1 glutamine amidotransferase domain-containing protein n=1 Tax=Stenotrophomonas sp. SY1 TaxID=477235 RepID=UPI001E2A5900|nr:type 1 glutamine amidotransferase domain-containing protein [Stenotrophomonas sp. SY1]MCD9088038.1 type 1 glutamine amidotransferase domain-containing protein [Stenotrophomonas sp. SY1]
MNPLSRVLLTASVCLLATSATPLLAAPSTDKVLIVVSGEGKDTGKQRPGYEFDELSQAWGVFKANGLEVEIASPKGGPVEADKYNPAEPFNAALLADKEAMRKLADTQATSTLEADDYAAIYVVGGKGAMFDLPRDASLRQLAGRIWDNGGIVAAVCHGPAALVDVRLADGSLLVNGRKLTGFSNEEEALFGKKWAAEFPWLLEDTMRQRGAHWAEAPLMMPKLVVDGRLITGQNPYSTYAVAEAIVRATGRTPVARTPSRDELSMALVERLLAGDAQGPRDALATEPGRYHIDLIGILGYYQAQAATDDAALEQALQVMDLALPHMHEPQLKLAAAEAHLKLKRPQQARTLVLKALETDPKLEQAQALLQRIDG